MIARYWRGETPAAKADAYHDYMTETGVNALRATPGNQGVYMLRRIDGDTAEFIMLSLWDSMDAIRAFAGDDPEVAVYFPEDKDYLLVMDPHVTHYDVMENPMPDNTPA